MKRTAACRRIPKRRMVVALLVMAACVQGAALFAALRLRANADLHAKAALNLAKFEEKMLELDRAADQALLLSPSPVGDDPRLTEIRGVRVDFGEAMRIGVLAVGSDDRAALRDAAVRFETASDALMQRVTAGHRSDALVVESAEHAPAFDRLHDVLGTYTDRSKAAAADSRRVADRGFIAILVATGVGIAGLAGAAGIARRRADRVLAEGEALRRSEARFRALMTNGDDVVVVTDPNGVILEVSDPVTRVLGVSPQAVLGRRLTDLVHPDEVAAAEAELARVVTTGSPDTAEWRCRDGAGSWRYLDATITNLIDVPEVGAIVLNVRDVSSRRRLEDELRHRAFHDSLTGLANRALLRDRIAHVMARRQASDAALLVLDLDGFKSLNDSLGHLAGDHALAVVADRLRGASRPGDTVARLGGDEFAILIEDDVARDGMHALAQRLVDVVVEPFTWQDQLVRVGTCVGIAFVEPGLHGPDDLVRNADVALYAAKAVGTGSVRNFDPAMHDDLHERFILATELRDAIDGDQLILHYQPVIELSTGELTGFEALVRWEHPTRGLTPPDSFIPIAEESGLIVPLGRWVLREACRAVTTWSEHDATRGPLRISVNVSGRQLEDPDFVEMVADALRDARLDPGQLVLEITETALMHNVQDALLRLTDLKELGVHLAVDDFGTGYSSLSYLQRFPVDTVKIDKAFIDGVTTTPDDAAFLQAILSLGDALHLNTVAEGVETAEQAHALERLGCRLAQGYHFARPLPADRVAAWLRSNALVTAAD
jgi:diguanylate cyclase (GGDEF)-like protein/PAS domain S-box-containing protein